MDFLPEEKIISKNQPIEIVTIPARYKMTHDSSDARRHILCENTTHCAIEFSRENIIVGIKTCLTELIKLAPLLTLLHKCFREGRCRRAFKKLLESCFPIGFSSRNIILFSMMSTNYSKQNSSSSFNNTEI